MRGGLLRISSFTPAMSRRRRMWATVETMPSCTETRPTSGLPELTLRGVEAASSVTTSS